MRTITKSLILALPVALAACVSGGDAESPAYQAGFDDGCATAGAEASHTARAPQRDAHLYQTDTNYRAGWLSGHAACAAPPSPSGR